MRFDNKMLKPVISKYTANMNENLNLTSLFEPRCDVIKNVFYLLIKGN